MKNVNNKKVKSVIEELGIKGEFNLNEVNIVYDVVTIGNEILRKENEDVTNIEEEINTIINMVHTLYDEEGCGIAAPQIGINKNIFIVKVVGEDENGDEIIEYPLKVFINPKIIEYSDETDWSYEGCLSVPGFFAMVERSKNVKIEYLDIYGQKHVDIIEDFPARAVQHEYDHLNGVIYTDIADIETLIAKENFYKEKEE